MDNLAYALGNASLELVSPKTLLTPRRLDLAVKWRYFMHELRGGDPESEWVYLWHIDKRKEANARLGLGTERYKPTTSHYLVEAEMLLEDMAFFGFLPEGAIPIDPDGELLGGAHRAACALALGIDCYVQPMPQKVWAPAWDKQWFIDNGMSEEDLARTLADWDEMCRSS